jgi:hypothetical protein
MDIFSLRLTRSLIRTAKWSESVQGYTQQVIIKGKTVSTMSDREFALSIMHFTYTKSR